MDKANVVHFVFWHWFALALALGIVDLLVGANFLLVWCGIAAASVGVILLLIPKLGWEYQLLLFGIGVLASFFVWQFYTRKIFGKFKPNTLNQRGRQYIGRHFTLEEPIVNGLGRIRVDDTIWRVEGDDLPVGAKVKVVDVNGIILKVKLVSDS